MRYMNFFFLTILCFFLSIIPHETATATDIERYLIRFHEQIHDDVIERYGGQVEDRLESLQAVVATFSEAPPPELVCEQQIAYVEKDERISIRSTQVVDWGIAATNAPTVWNNGLTGKGVKIAVIDTGIDMNHPDLQVKKGFSAVPYTTSFADDNGHGTQVAAIIAAKNNEIGTIGMAYDSELYVAKAFDRNGDGFHSHLVKAIDWAVKEDVDIINLSVGSIFYSTLLDEAVQRAYDSGILVVAAAGNRGNRNGIGDQIDYPAKLPAAIAVAAIDKADRRASFSATGAKIEVAAPGVDVVTANVGGGYVAASGTSMATPHVTGHLALLKQAYPTLSAEALRTLLREQTIDITKQGRNPHVGYGKIFLPSDLTIPDAGNDDELTFSDIRAGDWFKEEVYALVKRNVIFGYSDQTFQPRRPISRGEVAVILQRALELSSPNSMHSYEDVDEDHYAKEAIAILTEKGYITGYPDHTFRPYNSITRGEVATILARIASLASDERVTFTDIEQDYYAKDAIEKLAAAEIMKGYLDGSFRPKASITRAEFAAVVYRLLLQ